ncbi:MAG: tetratricopeptide repeat protein [Acidobacteriota bacterium]
MGFDKAKAMRNAERFVAQGKIRSAISEYRAVVDHDPRDVATLNMLGDLYAKSAEKRDAVNCYMQVAEHYNTQGFAQKAIAVYNKISRIQPDSIEVSAKLAELHKGKGSLSEARAHYTTLAQHYEKTGRRLEALSMYKQIALLDPNNTEVCLSLADSYIREGQRDDAIEAYAEAGARFSRQGNYDEAVLALMKGFDIRSTDLRILNGLVKAQTALGRAGKAVSLLEEILENEPQNRDVLYLMIECCMDSQNAAAAEKAVIKLVEIEPANHSKFLELIKIYLNVNDAESAARVLTMCSEYMLAGGQAAECGKWIDEILERDPAQLTGLRLLIRYHSWLKDEVGFQLALERLYGSAAALESVEDERFALAQLVVIRPDETAYQERLNQIVEEHGYEDSGVDAELLRAQFAGTDVSNSFAIKVDGETVMNGNGSVPDTKDSNGYGSGGGLADVIVLENSSGFEFAHADAPDDLRDNTSATPISLSDEEKIQKELESVSFYIENDYNELAEKALAELAAQYGDRPEFEKLRKRIGAELPSELKADSIEEMASLDTIETVEASENIETVELPPSAEFMASTLGIDDIRSEFGIESTDETDDSDYDTHYQMGVAYQEMGLTEEAIREFQDAISLTSPKDGTRRFFQCSNLLGHCFMQNGMATHAIKWITRALETPDICEEEHHGLWYELALAHEANGDDVNAAKYFEQVYAENVDFRDVSERVKNLVAEH